MKLELFLRLIGGLIRFLDQLDLSIYIVISALHDTEKENLSQHEPQFLPTLTMFRNCPADWVAVLFRKISSYAQRTFEPEIARTVAF